MLGLRPYQRDALTAVDKAAAGGHRRSLIVLPTGAGKTVVFSHLVGQRPGRSIVLVHRNELVDQTVSKIGLIAPELSVGVVKADRDEHGAHVVVASIQTVYRDHRMARLSGFSTVVVDEAHHASAPSWHRVLEHLGSFTDDADGPLTIGFTATPERDQGKKLGHIWQGLAYYRSIREMIFEGYLSPVAGQMVETDMDLAQVRVTRGDFSEASLGQEMLSSGALAEIADAYARYAADRKSVAFTPTVATAQQLAHELIKRGIPAEAVWGNMALDERRAVLGRLRSGETHCVTNCAVLTEGFDEPSVDCIVVARPTRSHSLYIQMVGRGLRPYPGKPNCLVLDITGASERHDLVALVDLSLGFESTGQDPVEDEGAERSDVRCTLCNRPLAISYVEQGLRRHPNCRARRTSAVDMFATSKLRWLPVDHGFVLPSGKEVVVMTPVVGSDENWTLATYTGGRLEVLHASLPADWASGIGEDRAKAFGPLAKRDARWLAMPPTPAQLARLEREGLPAGRLGSVTTRGQAADLLTRIQGRRAIRKMGRTSA